MKIFTICLALALCAKLHGAAADDQARAFLINALANNAVTPLTNATLVAALNTRILVTTNPGFFAVAGGLVHYDTGAYTNLNGTGTVTNYASVIIPGNTLTNLGDRLRGSWGFKTINAAANTNRITVTYGATTLLDTGLQIASNLVGTVEILIVRTGNTSQHVEGTLFWGPGGGVPFIRTNVNVETSLNNGVSRTLSLNGASRRPGGMTNIGFRLYWEGIR